MSADQPLTADELATIRARAEAANEMPRVKWHPASSLTVDDFMDVDAEHIAGMDPATTLRLVAEIERLQAHRCETTSEKVSIAIDELEEGRRLASERDGLIAAGVDPSDLEIPL